MIDEVDRKILVMLQENARVSNAVIAREVGMAPSAIHERVRKLEERGIIEGYHARFNPRSLGYGLLAFVYVSSKDGCWCPDTHRELCEIPEVQECHGIAGEDCFLVKVRAQDTRHLNRILRDRFSTISSVTATRTTIALETNKESQCLPLGEVDDAQSL